MQEKPKIAIAGLGCETSTFTNARTDAAAFHPLRGDEIISGNDFLHPKTQLGTAATWRGALTGHALPGGIVTRQAFEGLSAEILHRLDDIVHEAGGELDGLWFDIHGAMCVEGMDDAEAELLRRIRTSIGSKTVVSASMDLHGNVSRRLIHQVDLITCFRMAPHEDEAETKERACRNLVDFLYQRKADPTIPLPLKAWIPLPILLPGEQTSTRLEPAKSLYALLPCIEATPGVLDAGIWIGYAWADEPRNRAGIIVTGTSEHAVASGCEKLARSFWAVHADFRFVAPTGTFPQCLSAALSAPRTQRPYFISDSGDNPTAGGSGDVTYALHRLLSSPALRQGPVVIYASLPIGPGPIRQCLLAGPGAAITLHNLGATIDFSPSPPLPTLTGRIHAIKTPSLHAGTEVVLQAQNTNLFIILTEERKPYHHLSDFTDLDLDPCGADVVVVKIGYLEPELYAVAKGWMLALTPGGVDQDLVRLGHARIRRPMWPFDRDFGGREPDLRARFVAGSTEEGDGVV